MGLSRVDLSGDVILRPNGGPITCCHPSGHTTYCCDVESTSNDSTLIKRGNNVVFPFTSE